MADFNAEESLAAEEPLMPTPVEPIAEPTPSDEPSDNQIAASSITKTAAEEPKPTWRASSVKVNENRVEGFATTAGGPVARVASSATRVERQADLEAKCGRGDRRDETRLGAVSVVRTSRLAPGLKNRELIVTAHEKGRRGRPLTIALRPSVSQALQPRHRAGLGTLS